MTLLVHIAAGATALISGAIALYAVKGGRLHRQAGLAFVFAMMLMCAGGFVVAIGRSAAPLMNGPAALTTAYLVITGLLTVRSPSPPMPRLNVAVLCVGIGVAFTCLALGVAALASPAIPDGFAFPLFMFGTVGTFAAIGDFRIIRSGERHGRVRLARHLWRMCFALFIAAASFFLGQAGVFPEVLRIGPLLGLPPLAVLATMIYWLTRVRSRRRPPPVISHRPAEAN
jgi:hypothetical protein